MGTVKVQYEKLNAITGKYDLAYKEITVSDDVEAQVLAIQEQIRTLNRLSAKLGRIR